jgi:hypothetical protein
MPRGLWSVIGPFMLAWLLVLTQPHPAQQVDP